jgi:hypothetical protein
VLGSRTLLPAIRKICKITQNRPQKKTVGPHGRRFWPKEAENWQKKSIPEKHVFFLANFSFCDQFSL